MMLALKAPHSPLSAVTTTTSTRSEPRSSSSGWASLSVREAMPCSTSSILRAYGRAANIASCARRSLAADHHLHRLGDLLRALDAADPAPDVDEGGHAARVAGSLRP
jgi:hypothetical protein